MSDVYDFEQPMEPPRVPARRIDEDRPCLQCGYNLHGLREDVRCPECGSPVRNSLQGNLLRFSSPEYVASLHRGTVFILLAFVLQLLGILGMIVGSAIVLLLETSPSQSWDIAGTLVEIGFAALSLIGWWLFSMPDLAIVGMDTGDTPRKVLRATVIILAVATLGDLFAISAVSYLPGLEAISAIVSFVAGIVLFFASLHYIRWLSPRIPSDQIADRAKSYLWLLPLIYVIGACLIIGPLIAVIMYFLLINEVRGHLVRIREEQESTVIA